MRWQGTAILKNGGCPMMRCAECGGAFRWGRFSNTTKHVIVEHLPVGNVLANMDGSVRAPQVQARHGMHR